MQFPRGKDGKHDLNSEQKPLALLWLRKGGTIIDYEMALENAPFNELTILCEMVRENCLKEKLLHADYRFTRKELREHTGWSHDQIQSHLRSLTELEYVVVHKGGRGQTLVYELLFDPDTSKGSPHLPGLIDAQRLGSSDEVLGVTSSSSGGKRESSVAQMGPICGPNGGHLWPPANQSPEGFESRKSHLSEKSIVEAPEKSSLKISVLSVNPFEAMS